MGGLFTKRRVDDPKWFHPIAAMLLSADIVRHCLIIDRPVTKKRKTTYLLVKLAGITIFDHLLRVFPCEHLQEFGHDGFPLECGDIYNTILNKCKEVNPDNSAEYAWRETLLMSHTIDLKIYSLAANKINFDEKLMQVLLDSLDYNDSLSSMLPMVRGYFIYSLGEALVSFPEVNYLDRWYEILQMKYPNFLPIIIIPKLTTAVITIDIPRVLIEIVISYSKWERHSREKVITELSKL
ncbi:MAG: hypothetical protein Harvfovirus31_2 [Harvfovirus sp.]|uniref:Uncharacterized protein n=1 Tax=Harvfovirus sp. TaxID=2487768 RepID=A0A3G5A2D4_9VIRU|nr:MAG: hypothetical protein Harvfovirus31_2 [Harvfovirus sp.]